MRAWIVVAVLAAGAAAQSPPIFGGGGGGATAKGPGGKVIGTKPGGPQGGQPTPGDAGSGATTPGSTGKGAAGPGTAAGAGGRGAPAGGDRGWDRATQTGGADLDAITGGETVDDWWIWWEINKNLWLIPQRELAARGASRYATPAEIDAARRARMREAAVPQLVAALRDDAAPVRAASATALGRLGGEAAVEPLVAALGDTVLTVREAVLLALGATGSARASATLLGIAGEGRLPGGEPAGASERPVALVALAIGRRHGLGPDVDALVQRVVESSEDPDVQVAGLVYNALAGGAGLGQLAGALSARKELDLRVRCRVTEALPAGDPAFVPAVFEELEQKNIERRRSAAAALGLAADPSVIERLVHAFEDEEEPLTRGFLLVTAGQLGGEAARDFLLAQQRRGRAADRPWVALGLGLHARASGDAKARAALREGLREESSAETRGAWLLACGLAQDPESGPALREALAGEANPRLRMFAALALAMLRDEPSLAALRERLDEEDSPLAVAGVCLGVALYGQAPDAPRLVARLAELDNPVLQAQVAAAIGTHGSAPAADGLTALLEGDELSDLSRASALEALGLLLDPVAGFALTRAAAQRNFSVFPEWLARILGSTSL